MTAPIVYAPRTTDELDHVELWTDVEANGGLLLAPIAAVMGVTQTQRVDGEDTVTLTIPLNHPLARLRGTPVDDENLRVDQVLRLVKTNGDWTEHRISESTKRNRAGIRTRELVARSILQDLGFRAIITRSTADGSTTATFEVLSLPIEDHLREFILPAARIAGQAFWIAGTIEFSGPVDIVYDRDTVLSALRKLCAAAGGLELQAEAGSQFWPLHFLQRIGSTFPTTVLRSRRDLVDVAFTERGDDQATRVLAFGAPYQDDKPTLGLARWSVLSVTPNAGGVTNNYDIRLADPAGGDGPIKFDGQFLPPDIVVDDPTTDEVEVLPRFHLTYTTEFDWVAPIIDTFAATQTVRCQATYAPPDTTKGQLVKIVADALSHENLAVDHPAMVKKYGVRVGTLDRPDIPGTDNFVPNPLCRAWPDNSPLPTGWQGDDGGTYSRETNPAFWVHGGQAIRASWPAALAGQQGLSQSVIRTPIARLPHRAQGYLSFFVQLLTLKGKIKIWIALFRGDTDLAGNPLPPWSYNFPESSGIVDGDPPFPEIMNIQYNVAEQIGVAAAWDLNKYPLYGGTAQIGITAAYPGPDDLAGIPPQDCEVIIQAVQITNTSEQQPLIEGNGGVRLHQAANGRVALYGSPSPVLSADLLRIAYEDGLRFPYTPFQVGSNVRVEDPDNAMPAVETRIVGTTRDWKRRAMLSLELSNQRPDITRLMATKPAAVARHGPWGTPQGLRGLSYPT